MWSTCILSLPRWLAGAARRSSGESWKRSEGSAASKDCLERRASRSDESLGNTESKSLAVSKVVRKVCKTGLKRERVAEVSFKICRSYKLMYMFSPFIC